MTKRDVLLAINNLLSHQISKRPAEDNSLLARVRDATWTLVNPRLSLPEIAAALHGPSAVAGPTEHHRGS